MKVGIIGGGISGISVARFLKTKGVNTKIFESKKKVGGLISCEKSEGVLFHKTGGHVFNSNNLEIKKWFFSHFDIDKDFIQTKRNAKISIQDKLIDYPIENNIFQLPKKIGEKAINEILKLEKTNYSSFEEYLKTTFGNTLYEIYFKPYNSKIWLHDISKISMDWLKDKLPMPNKEDILINNIYRNHESKMAHSSFYYPKTGGSQFIIDKLSSGLEIVLKQEINEIKYLDGKWIINNEIFDKIIYTGNIRNLPSIIHGINLTMIDFDEFKFHGTTTVLCEVESNDLSWLYLPDEKLKAHRIIMTGNFSKSNNGSYKCTATIEFSDYLDINEVEIECKKINSIKKIIDYNYSKYSYVIQDKHTRKNIQLIKDYLSPNNFFLLGRFAEWEYYNMDTAMIAAKKLSNKITE